MEWLAIVKATVAGNWEVLAFVMVPFILPNSWLDRIGYAIGKVCTKVLRQKVGRRSEKWESWFQGTMAAFIGGINRGLDSDDAV